MNGLKPDADNYSHFPVSLFIQVEGPETITVLECPRYSKLKASDIFKTIITFFPECYLSLKASVILIYIVSLYSK